jgi:thioredoxin-dependent peroxiredoxin
VIAPPAALCEETGMLKPGDRAPDFTATAHDGSRIALKDYRGKKVLLYFFPRADTPG